MNLHQYAETHEVTNQVPSLDGANLYRLDLPLQEWAVSYTHLTLPTILRV